MNYPSPHPQLGAVPCDGGTVSFAVWAPAAKVVAVRAGGIDHELAAEGDGFFVGDLDGAGVGADYYFVLDGERVLPDPCSRWQPQGVDGPSRVLDPASFRWTDDGWARLLRDELILYELHVGTFSDEGTFDSAIEHLAELSELGVTAVEVMPIATFPGNRNWGYDGVYTFAPHTVYGGPDGFARFVDAAHAHGLGVILDVVYNHVGPGADLAAFGPYFTDLHTTFWGDAVDYARRGVREWAIQNAEQWVRDYHVDGLRLDATHAVFDENRPHILEELGLRVRALSPQALVISEMETGDLRPIREWGHDSQWADEFHHVLHVLLTGEHDGYYSAYRPSVTDLAAQLTRRPARGLVFCSQNHDQVGNRAYGDRPAPDQLRLRAAALMFAPQVPLLFMGEEYGEQRPFQYFTDHQDPLIAEATRAGRRREFAQFAAYADDLPDPQNIETFEASKLNRRSRDDELHTFYAQLLALRLTLPARVAIDADDEARYIRIRRGEYELSLNFSPTEHDGVGARDLRLRRIPT